MTRRILSVPVLALAVWLAPPPEALSQASNLRILVVVLLGCAGIAPWAGRLPRHDPNCPLHHRYR